MAKGNGIIVSSQPMGKFLEGYVNAALKPGTVCQIDVSEGIGADGKFDWEAYNRDADGNRPAGPLAVLLHDSLQGKIATDAYVSGDRCFLYVPLAADELNMILADVAGTGDDHAFGEMLIVDDGTGKLIATTGSPENEPFMCLETITDPTADTLTHCIYSGF